MELDWDVTSISIARSSVSKGTTMNLTEEVIRIVSVNQAANMDLKTSKPGMSQETTTYSKKEQVYAHRKLMRRAMVGKYDHGMNNLEETKR